MPPDGPDPGQLAVTLHGVEPATFAHCALIRDWLGDLGVDRVTLMVIPAADHHPFFQRSPALADWLHERRAAGDGVAQQGFVGSGAQGGVGAVSAQVRAGRRLMALAGLTPGGYEAPTLAHALGARRELTDSYAWWMAPGLWRAGRRLRGGRVLRVALSPDDFHRGPARVRALEQTLRAESVRRRPVTFDELADEGVRLRADAPRVPSVG